MSTFNIPFSTYKKKITLKYLKSAVMAFYTKRLKNEFETAVVNEPSVFEPLKFYCIHNTVNSQYLYSIRQNYLDLLFFFLFFFAK